jgi:hypothetical protein
MSAEHFEMPDDCVIIPNSDCPDNCELQNVSKYDILAAACEADGNPTFNQHIDPNTPLLTYLDTIEFNMKATLEYNVSPRSCKNLQELFKSAWDEE